MNIKKILIVIFTFFCINISTIFAGHECIYSYEKEGKNADVTIYYEDDKVKVSGQKVESILKDFRKGWGALNLGYEYEEANTSSPLLTESVDYAIDNDACPGSEEEIFVCAGIINSLSVPIASQVFGAGEFLATIFSPIWEKYDSFWDYILSLGDAISEIFEYGYTKEVLIVSASQADAENSYGYQETGWFDIKWEGFYRGKEDMDFSLYSSSNIECETVYYIGTKTTFNLNCPALGDSMSNLSDSAYEYKMCGDDYKCKTDKLNKVNEYEEKLKSQCSSILQNQDYILTEDGKVNSCMTACLSLKNTITDIKNNANIKVSGKRVCGFSERLLVWVMNVLKWIKYILPVVVIILSILDFIRAIGGDKEDEMKKAQKKFIIRLIAAALVFIIPLIIEFILIKMGFVYESCGLFD